MFSHRHRIALAAALTLALSPAATASAQQDQEEVELKLTPLAGPVYMLEGSGGNIGVSAGEDGVLMVDDQFAPLAPRIQAALEALGKGPVDFVINTHWHGDHVGGNEFFGRDAVIVAHERVRERLATEQVLPRGTAPARPKVALPVVTFESGLSLHFNGEEIRVIHLPKGHTDGDAAVWFTGSKVLHVGDHHFGRRFPFIDLDSGGSVGGYLDNLDRLLALVPSDVQVIGGHGPLSTMADLQACRDMVAATRQVVREARLDGRSLDEILEKGLGERWAPWAWTFVGEADWIRTLHRDLLEN